MSINMMLIIAVILCILAVCIEITSKDRSIYTAIKIGVLIIVCLVVSLALPSLVEGKTIFLTQDMVKIADENPDIVIINNKLLANYIKVKIGSNWYSMSDVDAYMYEDGVYYVRIGDTRYKVSSDQLNLLFHYVFTRISGEIRRN